MVRWWIHVWNLIWPLESPKRSWLGIAMFSKLLFIRLYSPRDLKSMKISCFKCVVTPTCVCMSVYVCACVAIAAALHIIYQRAFGNVDPGAKSFFIVSNPFQVDRLKFEKFSRKTAADGGVGVALLMLIINERYTRTI